MNKLFFNFVSTAAITVFALGLSSASFAGNPQGPKPKAATQTNIHTGTGQNQNYHQQNAGMGQACYKFIPAGNGHPAGCTPAGAALNCAQKGLLNQIQCGDKMKAANRH